MHDMMYNVLLQADIDDMLNLCNINNTSQKICHDRHFLNQKFDLLPFKIYKPISHTFNNLLMINQLVKLAIKLINFMKHTDGIQLDFLNLDGEDKDYIIDIKKFSPSLYNKIITISNDLTYEGINFINVPLNTKPNLTHPSYGRVEFFHFMYKNGKYDNYMGIRLPHGVDLTIPVNNGLSAPVVNGISASVGNGLSASKQELIGYLVNIFLNYKEFRIGRYDYTDIYRLENLTSLDTFISQNPNDIIWEKD
jgi:hypothetical protein